MINWKKIKISHRDVTIWTGLAMVGAGLWMYCPWVALVTVGALLILAGLFKSEER